MHRIRAGLILLPLLLALVPDRAATQTREPAALAPPVHVVYYWRARPGKLAAYSDYIRTVAEPIDEEARKAGVFEGRCGPTFRRSPPARRAPTGRT